jgi:ring-1,2-phenylacetyl-CoA epoxidase subunit PaaD
MVTLTKDDAYAVAATVADPELPVLTIAELGILRDVRVREAGTVEVDLTPTYAGCPALEAIRADVTAALRQSGAREVVVRIVLAPAWSSEWISAGGRAKLSRAGIAPPTPRAGGPVAVELSVRCPRCGSLATEELSGFGPTPCTSLRRCTDCLEPFEYVKAL